MRKNTNEVFRAWMYGRSKGKPGASIWTDGDAIYSYRTCIATRDAGRLARAVLNRTPYSITTTIHQNGLASAMPTWMKVRYVENLPLGASRRDLIDRARVSWREPGATYPRPDCGVRGCGKTAEDGMPTCAAHHWMTYRDESPVSGTERRRAQGRG